MSSDGLIKRGTGARKVKAGHYLVFQGKAISKKRHCHRGKPLLVYEYKGMSTKIIIVLRGAAIMSQNKVNSKKSLYFRHATNVVVLL